MLPIYGWTNYFAAGYHQGSIIVSFALRQCVVHVPVRHEIEHPLNTAVVPLLSLWTKKCPLCWLPGAIYPQLYRMHKWQAFYLRAPRNVVCAFRLFVLFRHTRALLSKEETRAVEATSSLFFPARVLWLFHFTQPPAFLHFASIVPFRFASIGFVSTRVPFHILWRKSNSSRRHQGNGNPINRPQSTTEVSFSSRHAIKPRVAIVFRFLSFRFRAVSINIIPVSVRLRWVRFRESFPLRLVLA